jgi:uncharacterized protein YcbX
MTAIVEHTIIYPIKSMAGIACNELELTDRGAKGDRRWMLIDAHGRFISQREWSSMCLFDVGYCDGGFEIRRPDVGSIQIPFALESGNSIPATVWSDTLLAIEAEEVVNQFFTSALSTPCKLVYMPDSSLRMVDTNYAGPGVLTSFSDGYPILLLGSASLNDLNDRLLSTGRQPIGWERFRPNFVVKTSRAFEEDVWAEFKMGTVKARGVKLCSRCVMTTIDTSTATPGKEPLATLSKYRTMNGKVMFGQNVIAEVGVIRVGDAIEVVREGYPSNAVF